MKRLALTVSAALLLAGTSLVVAQTTVPVPGGNAATGPRIVLTPEQRVQAVTVLRGVNVQPVTGVTLAVGQPVPTTVTQMVACPATVQSMITGVQNCQIVSAGDNYYVVEGGSRQVVTSFPRQ